MVRTVLVAILSALSVVRASAQSGGARVPTALTATAATRVSVGLTWTGDPSATFVVERKPLGVAWPTVAPATPDPSRPTPSAIATISETKATDVAIEPFATYVYRVRAVGAGNAISAPSNEITVGPPPIGFSSIVAAPKPMQEHDTEQFANISRIVLDANSDPAIAFVTFDLNNDGEFPDSDLSFVTWSRARYRWNVPVRVDTVGNVSRAGTTPPVSVAFDGPSNTFATIYLVGEHELRVSMSKDGGATWSTVTVLKTGNNEGLPSTPSLALAAGRVHVAYFVGNVGVRYATGAIGDRPDGWQTTTAPLLAGTSESRSQGISVVVDGSGRPGVAYWLTPEEGYTSTAAFWRPGSAPVKIADTNGKQNDDPGLTVAASGNQIAAGLYAARDEQFFADHHLWFSRSTDGGATWSKAAVVADDGGNAMGAPFTVTLDRAGHAAMVANVGGGNEGANKCGQPKLARSTDGTGWTTCAPDTRGAGATLDIFAPTGVFAANDKLYLVFKVRGGTGPLAPGLALWRER